MADAISNIDENGDLEHQQAVIKDAAASVFLGGYFSSLVMSSRPLNLFIGAADTTPSAIHTLFVAMISFPKIDI